MVKGQMERWIPVVASMGMFSSECAISLKLFTGEDVSFFADKSLIQEHEGRSLLKVTLIDEYPEQHKLRVLLPSETFETASRWVEVAT